MITDAGSVLAVWLVPGREMDHAMGVMVRNWDDPSDLAGSAHPPARDSQ